MNQRQVTDAVIARLTADGILVGDGVAPDGGGWDDAMTVYEPFVVVFPIPGGTRTGNLAEHEADASMVYQVTCVGPTAASAERLVDDVGLSFRVLQGTDAGTLRISLTRNDFGSHQVRREDAAEPTEPALYLGTPRWRLWVTPNGL